MNKNVKKRIIFFLISVITFLIIGQYIFKSLRKNTVYFFTPSELFILSEIPRGTIRIGGMVKKNSLNKKNNTYQFIITDFKQEVKVEYVGVLPNLFVEGQGAVIEGKLIDRLSLKAENILAKHDEKYMPKEVADALKNKGSWQKKYGK
jgi:cytochrome c-type biogenesis protein CcmE